MEAARPSRAEQTLTEVRRLRRRTHARAHSGAWLPAAAFAAMLLTSIALYQYPFGERRSASISLGDAVWDFPFLAGLPDPQRSPFASYLFWFIGTPVVLGLTGLWYQWRAQRLGLRVAWPLFAGTGLAMLLLLAVLASVPVQAASPLAELPPLWSLRGVLTPMLPAAAAVVVLGWAERSRALAFAGGWIAILAVWQCGYGSHLGEIPDGELTLLGIHRPGPTLIIMALPLLVFAAVRGVRAHRADR